MRMPSTATSQIIFFIAAMVVSIAIAGTLISTTYRFSDDIERRGNSMGDYLNTDIAIINDATAMPYNSSNNTLTVYVLNTGSTTIPLNNQSVYVLINGTAYTNLSFVLPKDVTSWGPKTLLTIYVHELTLPANDYKLKVYAGGISAEMEFRIT